MFVLKLRGCLDFSLRIQIFYTEFDTTLHGSMGIKLKSLHLFAANMSKDKT